MEHSLQKGLGWAGRRPLGRESEPVSEYRSGEHDENARASSSVSAKYNAGLKVACQEEELSALLHQKKPMDDTRKLLGPTLGIGAANQCLAGSCTWHRQGGACAYLPLEAARPPRGSPARVIEGTRDRPSSEKELPQRGCGGGRESHGDNPQEPRDHPLPR